jgi:hypothetical protein
MLRWVLFRRSGLKVWLASDRLRCLRPLFVQYSNGLKKAGRIVIVIRQQTHEVASHPRYPTPVGP